MYNLLICDDEKDIVNASKILNNAVSIHRICRASNALPFWPTADACGEFLTIPSICGIYI